MSIWRNTGGVRAEYQIPEMVTSDEYQLLSLLESIVACRLHHVPCLLSPLIRHCDIFFPSTEPIRPPRIKLASATALDRFKGMWLRWQWNGYFFKTRNKPSNLNVPWHCLGVHPWCLNVPNLKNRLIPALEDGLCTKNSLFEFESFPHFASLRDCGCIAFFPMIAISLLPSAGASAVGFPRCSWMWESTLFWIRYPKSSIISYTQS